MALVVDSTIVRPLLLYGLLTLCLSYICYAALLHPLSKYPGPLLAKFTEMYGGYWALRRISHTVTRDNFLKYGPVYRHAPNRLVFLSPTAFRDIYLNLNVMKGHAYYYATLTSSSRHVQIVVDRAAHKKKRKVVAPVLNERSMRTFEPTMLARIDDLLLQLREAAQRNTTVNMTTRIRYFTIDVAASLSFGFAFNLQTDATYRHIPETIVDWLRYMNANQQCGLLWRFTTLIIGLQRKKTMKFSSAVQKMVQTRMSQGKDSVHDFCAVASELGADEEFFRSELWSEAAAFLIAAGMTTAHSICGTLFFLSRYPSCYKTLAHEIRTTFATGAEIKAGAKLNSCKYLRACIEEALRCTSPALSPTWREQDPVDKGVFVVDGHVIPRGTQVAVPLYSLFHSEDIFEDPYVYRPERWLESDEILQTKDEKEAKETMRQAFVPFLMGDRDCPGRPMAWLELSLVLAHIIWHFDFEKSPGKASRLGEKTHIVGGKEVPEFIGYDIVVADHNGPNLIFCERKEATDISLQKDFNAVSQSCAQTSAAVSWDSQKLANRGLPERQPMTELVVAALRRAAENY